MNTVRTLWWFLAGAAVFHALTHTFFWVADVVPLDFKWFILTPRLNQIELWVSLLFAGFFVYLATKK